MDDRDRKDRPKLAERVKRVEELFLAKVTEAVDLGLDDDQVHDWVAAHHPELTKECLEVFSAVYAAASESARIQEQLSRLGPWPLDDPNGADRPEPEV